MSKEELKNKLKALADKYENDKINIYQQYASENNDISIGDIVTDNYHTIKVEKMDFHYNGGEPMMVYHGPDYKKDGTPSKRQTNTPVYQCNIKMVNNITYKYGK